MLRMPLLLETPSIYWDCTLPECDLFSKTMNVQNVKEMDNFLSISDRETKKYFTDFETNAPGLLKQALKMLESNQPLMIKKAMRCINELILRSPKNCKELPIAIKVRANQSLKFHCFEAASDDYEMFLYVHQEKNNFEDLCEVSGNLTICFYLMRQYKKAKIHLNAFINFRDCLPKKVQQERLFRELQNQIIKFSNELSNTEDWSPNFSLHATFPVPFKGYNTSSDIPLSSSACVYDSDKPSTGVYCNIPIPDSSIVFIEHPIVRSLTAPFAQCELCFRRRNQLFTCLDCRCKTYCSLTCIEQDKSNHKKECFGYKCLILVVLDAVNLYNLFARVSRALDEHVFGADIFGTLKTAAEVFEAMDKHFESNEIVRFEYLKMLKPKPDFQRLNKLQFATCVAKSFRLTIYIEKCTVLMQSYFRKLPISNKQKMIVIGSILLRINYILTLDSFDFQLKYSLTDVPLRPQTNIRQHVNNMAIIVKPVRDRVVDNIDNFYKINKETEILEPFNQSSQIPPARFHLTMTNLEHKIPCDSIQSQLCIYKDIIAESYFRPDALELFICNEGGIPRSITSTAMLSERIWYMNEMERYQFVHHFFSLFHLYYVDYFLVMYDHQNFVRQTISMICTTLQKFRHSCAPNVEIILCENGVIMGKSLRAIIKGEELTVAYKANFMRHTRLERDMYLKRLGIKCQCIFCKMPEVNEPTNLRLGIYCDKCEGVEITPAHERCPNCKEHYNILCLRYQIDIKQFETDIQRNLVPNADDRQLYILHSIAYLKVKKLFSPFNEYRIYMELKYAKFLALKNFAKQSYNIFKEVRDNLLRNYHESLLWFTYYGDILDIIKVILFYNLDEGLYSVSTTCLRELCDIGLHILNGQKNYLALYETFDIEGPAIMEDLRNFFNWKEKVVCNDLSPLCDSLKQAAVTKKSKATNKRELDIMPTLSKKP